VELSEETTETTDTADTVEENPDTTGANTVTTAPSTDKRAEFEARKTELLQGSVLDLQKEYTPPVAYEPKEKTADDFRTSDDAQQAFLREEIDEDTFSQVVSKLGKPSNRSADYRDRADLAYQRELPKWAFQPPQEVGPKVQEMLELMEIEQEEREYAQQLPAGEDSSPYAGNETRPNPM
jgi:hypothetical protein